MWVVYNLESLNVLSRRHLKPQAKEWASKFKVTAMNARGEYVWKSGTHHVGVMKEDKLRTFKLLKKNY